MNESFQVWNDLQEIQSFFETILELNEMPGNFNQILETSLEENLELKSDFWEAIQNPNEEDYFSSGGEWEIEHVEKALEFLKLKLGDFEDNPCAEDFDESQIEDPSESEPEENSEDLDDQNRGEDFELEKISENLNDYCEDNPLEEVEETLENEDILENSNDIDGVSNDMKLEENFEDKETSDSSTDNNSDISNSDIEENPHNSAENITDSPKIEENLANSDENNSTEFGDLLDASSNIEENSNNSVENIIPEFEENVDENVSSKIEENSDNTVENIIPEFEENLDENVSSKIEENSAENIRPEIEENLENKNIAANPEHNDSLSLVEETIQTESKANSKSFDYSNVLESMPNKNLNINLNLEKNSTTRNDSDSNSSTSSSSSSASSRKSSKKRSKKSSASSINSSNELTLVERFRIPDNSNSNQAEILTYNTQENINMPMNFPQYQMDSGNIQYIQCCSICGYRY